MRIFQLFHNGNLIKFDVEELVDALERTTDRNIVLEFHCDLMIHQRLEEAVKKKKEENSLLALVRYSFFRLKHIPRE